MICLTIVSIFTTLYKILTAPIIGDDFLSPFAFWRSVNGGFKDAVFIGLEEGINGHFNFLGRLLSGLWNYLWVINYEIGVLSHNQYYSLSKLLSLCIALFAIIFCLHKLNPNQSKLLLTTITIIIFFTTIQYHGLWSNDPVSSYPILGYPSGALGFLSIVYFIKFIDKSKETKFREVLYVLSLLIFSILFYELNLSLVLVLGILVLGKYRKTLKKVVIIGLSGSILFSTLVFYSQTNNNYSGTQIKLSIEFFKSFFLSLFALIPFANLPLTFLASKSDNTSIIFIVIFAGLCLSLYTCVKFFFSGATYCNNVCESLIRTKFFVVYALGAAVIQSLLSKSQSDLKLLGHVYIAYSVMHMTLCLIIVQVLIKLPDLKKNFILHVLVSFLLVTQSLINFVAIEKSQQFYAENMHIIVLMESRSESERCLGLNEWISHGWPNLYRDDFIVSLQLTFEQVKDEPFCRDLGGEN
jgi:hypothetical protein